MQVKSDIVNTRYLPHTCTLLRETLPSVLRTSCFNDQNLPFNIEVKKTEIGHLFEHILLEYLCLDKFKFGHTKVVFNGRTRWNWLLNKYGSFEINIDAGYKDRNYLLTALEKALILVEKIYTFHETFCVNYENTIDNHPKIQLAIKGALATEHLQAKMLPTDV